MKHYESLCIFRPNLTEADVEKLIEKWSGIVVAKGGAISKMEKQGLKNFAVPIKGQTNGWHVLWEFDATVEGVSEVLRAYRLSDQVVRSMVTNKPFVPPPPAPPAPEAAPVPAAA